MLRNSCNYFAQMSRYICQGVICGLYLQCILCILFTGVFWNNPSEMWIDITSSKADRSTLGKIVDFVTQDDTVPQMDTRWVAESGVFDMYVMMGPAPYDVFRQYASLTGTTALPPVSLITLLLTDCVVLYYDIY